MDQEFLEILIFEVAGQRHGLSALQVQELLPALSIMPVPGASSGVEGVINLRGAILPVLDVRKRFGLPSKSLALTDHFIIVQTEGRLIALHVDRALDLARVDTEALANVDTLGSHRDGRAQVVKVGTGMVLLHQVHDLVATIDPQALVAAALPISGEARPS